MEGEWMSMNRLTGEQVHRAAGVMLAMAAGDALGAPYEFGAALPATADVGMIGGGSFGWEPGEWTDDTQMALVIAQAALSGADLRDPEVLDRVAGDWYEWSVEANDVGVQTRSVLCAASTAAGGGRPSSAHLQAASEARHQQFGKSAGNGSLMRTAPVALAYLQDRSGLAEAATQLSSLTHYDPEAGEACVLWCMAIRHAVLTGELDVRIGLDQLAPNRADVWSERIATAEVSQPADFTRNGWVVQALQAAWSAIANTRDQGRFPADHLRLALEAAVRSGNDTDTVAAIAGGLLGAAYGASSVPATWRRVLHGWPGLRSRDLVALGVLIARKGEVDAHGWPTVETLDYTSWGYIDDLARHPHDDGVWLGGVGTLNHLPDDVDAVVSLCRLGSSDVPARGIEPENHVEVWLVDVTDPSHNPHLDFVFADTADIIAEMRAEGRTVLVHCVQAQSRTPSLGAAHSMRVTGIDADKAIDEVCGVLAAGNPNEAFRQALHRFQ